MAELPVLIAMRGTCSWMVSTWPFQAVIPGRLRPGDPRTSCLTEEAVPRLCADLTTIRVRAPCGLRAASAVGEVPDRRKVFHEDACKCIVKGACVLCITR